MAMILNQPNIKHRGVVLLMLLLSHLCHLPEVRAGEGQNKERPRRVISLSPSNTELLFAIGGQDHLVGRTNRCDFPAAAAKIKSVGSLFPPDFERIIAERPDLIIMSDGNLKTRDKLRTLGVEVMVIHPRKVADIAKSMRRLGQALHRSHAADAIADKFEQDLRGMTATSINSEKVMYEVWHKPLMIPGPQTFLADIIRRAGGQPMKTTIAGDWPRVDLEWAISQNPTLILTQSPKRRRYYLNEKAPWRAVNAVRQNRVYTVPDESHFIRPGPRVLEAIAWLRTILNSKANANEKD